MAHIQLISLAETKSPDGRLWKFPFALPVIIRQLHKTRHTFDVLDTHLHRLDLEDLLARLDACPASIYGISAYSHNYAAARAIAARIRARRPDAVIIVGGLLARNDSVLLARTEVDIAVTGAEGEFILPELLDELDRGRPDLPSVRGLSYRDRSGGRIVRTPERPLMTDEQYQLLEMPDYEYFDRELREIAANIATRDDLPVKAFALLTMRGCPFGCTFCGHLYGRRFLKKRWDLFFDEIGYLQERYGFEGFFSYDTNMFFREEDVDDYCREYARRRSAALMLIELRPTFGSREMFAKLKDHGVRTILFGLESGSQEMLDRMKKRFHLPTMKKVIKAAIDAGLMIHGNFIFGTPGESVKTVRETRKFMMLLDRWIAEQKREFAAAGKACTSGYGFSILVPSPTSELYDVARSAGLIPDEESYLVSLSDRRFSRLLAGSNFKISLAEEGGPVNMSDFPSHGALVSYVRYSFALAAAYRRFLEWRLGTGKALRTGGALLGAAAAFARYGIEAVAARLRGKTSAAGRRDRGLREEIRTPSREVLPSCVVATADRMPAHRFRRRRR